MKQLYGPNIDINNAEVFVMKNEHSYAAFTGVLSNIYMKAHASSIFRNKPYVAALVINGLMMEPYKNQAESSFKRLMSIASKMKEPKGGIILGIFLSNNDMFSESSKIGLKHTVSQCWSVENISKEKDIITINLPPTQLRYGNNLVRYFEFNDIRKNLVDAEIQFVDYDTPIKELFRHFENSKVHICYQGGTSWLSVSMGISTIIIHPINAVDELHLKFKLFGQDLGNINIINDHGKIEHVRRHPCEYHVHIDDLKKALGEII